MNSLCLLLACLGGAAAAADWADAPTGNVKFIGDDEFGDFRDSNPRFLAFFFAPWCGHCKNAKPELSQASEKATLPIVAVDCTSSGSATCSEFSVSGYPTIKFFNRADGAAASEADATAYQGPRTAEGFVTFLERQVPGYVHSALDNTERGWGEADNGKVLFKGDDDFASFRAETPAFLAFFYAPWCGHCKNAKPELAKASETATVPVVALDCTSFASRTCGEFAVSGYPAIKYFSTEAAADEDEEATKTAVDYTGGRTTAAFLKFLNKQDPDFVPLPFKNIVPETWEESGRVVHMTDDHVDAFQTVHPRFLAFFYAPWCGHCKTAKPEFAKASARFTSRNMPFVAMDCTEDAAETCQKYGVKSYPTFKYFNGGDGSEPEDCFNTRDRDEVDFFNFVESKLAKAQVVVEEETDDGEAPPKAKLMKMRVRQLRRMLKERGARCIGCSQKEDFVALLQEKWTERAPQKQLSGEAHTETLMQEKYRKAAEASEAAGWEDGNEAVVHAYTLASFKKHIDQTEGKGALVMFFAPWCGVCNDQKPAFAEASATVNEELEKIEATHVGPFVAVNCDVTKTLKTDLCKEYGVESYPKYQWIERVSEGKFDDTTDFPGGRGHKGFTTYVAKKFGVDWTPPRSFVDDMGF